MISSGARGPADADGGSRATGRAIRGDGAVGGASSDVGGAAGGAGSGVGAAAEPELPRVALLGPSQVRSLAERLGVRPTKSWGQNFVVDAGTVRRIVRLAGVVPGEHVLEIGPGLGSLTLGLLEAGARVTAVEIDPTLARALPDTVAERAPHAAANLRVLPADALDLTPQMLRSAAGAGDQPVGEPPVANPLPADSPVADLPTALVANLPYNVAVPVLLTALERLPLLERSLVMVQAEVADRLAAPPGSRTYGIPSAKVAWYADARRVGTIGRAVFWPVPRVDSALVECRRRPVPETSASREQVFAVIDAAFAQRRKTVRAALAGLAGSGAAAEEALRRAGIDPQTRGERLEVTDFGRIAEALAAGARG